MTFILTGKKEFRDIKNIIELWDSAACNAVRVAGQKLMSSSKKLGGSFKDAWDKAAGIKLFEAGKIHITNFTLRSMAEGVSKFQSETNRTAMERLVILFAINHMLKNIGSFIEADIVSGKTIQLAREVQEDLLEEIRPDMISWVESFGYTDFSLASAIGERESDPYQRLYSQAKEYGIVNFADRERIVKETIFPLRSSAPKL